MQGGIQSERDLHVRYVPMHASAGYAIRHVWQDCSRTTAYQVLGELWAVLKHHDSEVLEAKRPQGAVLVAHVVLQEAKLSSVALALGQLLPLPSEALARLHVAGSPAPHNTNVPALPGT